MLTRSVGAKRPHIVLILADDLGWGDVGWNNPDMLDVTKVLTKLAREGTILDQYYTQQVCTPSRSALLTGMYPYHIGRQKGVIKPLAPTGLTLERPLLPEVLSKIGYATHMVGKWHLGFCKWEYTPTYRGFDTFYGFYTGAVHYFAHRRGGGLDMRHNEKVDRGTGGKYSTELFSNEASKLISSHNSSTPLFLYLAHQAVHAPLTAPRLHSRRTGAPSKKKRSKARQTFRKMVDSLDKGTRALVSSLKKAAMWDNTILIFTTDNGGEVLEGGNNWPLRGNKGTVFEGGTRGAAFIAGGALKGPRTKELTKELMHITDWFPTLLSAAGYEDNHLITNGLNEVEIKEEINKLENIDGVNQWEMLQGLQTNTTRQDMVYNIKMIPVSGAVRVGKYKLIFDESFKQDGWYNNDICQNNTKVKKHRKLNRSNHTNVAKGRNKKPRVNFCEYFDFTSEDEDDEFDSIWRSSFMANKKDNATSKQQLFEKKWPKLQKYLFDVVNDPEERTDLFASKPEIVEMLYQRVLESLASFVPRDFPAWDQKGDPKNFQEVWSPGWC